jgi:hypothetical protein
MDHDCIYYLTPKYFALRVLSWETIFDYYSKTLNKLKKFEVMHVFVWGH